VLSIEFKINLLRPARGERLVCRAKVLRGGKSVSVVESEVHAVSEGRESLVSKATVTLAIVPRPGKDAKGREAKP
jgi:acyl-coenzyme A thioesterase PaaI-like protein